MAKIHWFTDASVVGNGSGVCGFIGMDKKNEIVSHKMFFAKNVDNHILEVVALNKIMKFIVKKGDVLVDYENLIYTDSDKAFNLIRNYAIGKNPKTIQKSFIKYLKDIDKLAKQIEERGIDVKFYCVKAHCYKFEEQANYMYAQGYNFNDKQIKRICHGNFLIDRIVNFNANNPEIIADADKTYYSEDEEIEVLKINPLEYSDSLSVKLA